MFPLSSNNLQISLLESTLFLRGSSEESLGSFLRGELVLNLPNPMEIKKIEMNFVGNLRIYWTDSNKTYSENLINHIWSFLEPVTTNRDSNSHKRIFSNDSRPHLVPAGIYTFPFELYLSGSLPETVNTKFGNINYKLTATVTRSRFLFDLNATQPVRIVRTISDQSQGVGVAICKEWKNKFRYEITMPEKAVPMGMPIAIDIRVFPHVKKLQVNDVEIFLIESTTYKVRGQKRFETKTVSNSKFSKFEQLNKKEDENNYCVTCKENRNENSESFYFTKNISFPTSKSTHKMHFSCATSGITVSHYLRFSFNVRVPIKNNSHMKQQQIQFDVPITILSNKCEDDLPLYCEPECDYSSNYLHYEPPSYDN
ncbi:cyclin binding protein [Gigaspora margarita]|uniref:Cyclin binding protein n=1 Tax=Gigaspora margarita TaxID=4874 RepID=A0A8H4AJ27_GIGMA|nr:cyclin binding protein [Gigaspora margarita]